MSHTYSKIFIHTVFSTKERKRLITPEIQGRLWPLLGGIAKKNRARALAIGGVENHVHLLLSFPPDLQISKCLQLIKGGSSHWIHESIESLRDFEWQEGYAAFSIGVSGIDPTIEYIRHQAEHHRKVSFREEFTTFLKLHSIEYDPTYVFG